MNTNFKYRFIILALLPATLWAQNTNEVKFLNACKDEVKAINSQELYKKQILWGAEPDNDGNVSITDYTNQSDANMIYYDNDGRIRKFIMMFNYPETIRFSMHYFDKDGYVVSSICYERSAMDTSVIGVRYMHKNKLIYVDIELRDEEENVVKVIKHYSRTTERLPDKNYNAILHVDSLTNYCRKEDLTFRPDDYRKIYSTLPKVGEKTIVNVRESNIHEKPSDKANIVTAAHLGDIVEITEDLKNGWYKIQQNEKSGYVKAEFLELVEHEIHPELQKLDKLFVVGDFDGDGKQDTIFQNNFSKRYQMEIDSIPLSLEDDWFEMGNWFYRQESEVYLGLNKQGTEDLYLGTAFGLYCLLNIGDINADGKDEIAFVIDLFDESKVNTCVVYTLCHGKWKELKSFGIHESAFEFGIDETKPVFTEIKGFLEKHNGTWMYLDYSEYIASPNEQTEPQLKSLILEKCDK